MSKIAITLGDPASIGAEITRKALKNLKNKIDLSRIILIGNKKIYGKTLEDVDFIDIPSEQTIDLGKFSKTTGEIAFLSIKKAIELAKEKKIKAIVTAPISKEAINLAGYDYSGHTEILNKFLNGNAQMLFVAKDFRTLLLTRHVPLSQIPKIVTKEFIEKEIKYLYTSLQKIGIKSPKIALCGMNPHAGENGLLGKEEKTEFLPAIKILNKQNIQIEGPFAADMLFSKVAKIYKMNGKQPYDCYVSIYHDQGLCAVKAIDLEKTVNVTIGLEILRTSPAHGTAFDIAKKDHANFFSMQEAILLAYKTLN